MLTMEKVQALLTTTGLAVPEAPSQTAAFADRVAALLARPAQPPADQAALLELYTYRVPLLSPDGACSLTDELAPEPFDLRDAALAQLAPAALAAHPETVRLLRLQSLVGALHEVTGADWSGIYRRVSTGAGEPPALRKEAYRGRPSRALFPLTAEFAAHSNNSTAALQRRAVVVEDVEAHVAAGKPYYECDAEVRSELCIPVVESGVTRGLIDLESFRPNHFGPLALWATGVVSLAMLESGLLV
jgi:putative methionine-R-sulfoxide reductase with GAF domain